MTLSGGPLLFAVLKPAITPADTAVTNAGITVNAENPSDDIHLVSGSVDPSNKQISSAHPTTTADFVILLLGISNNNGNNFTAPISASCARSPAALRRSLPNREPHRSPTNTTCIISS